MKAIVMTRLSELWVSIVSLHFISGTYTLVTFKVYIAYNF